jgi:hypothetical protein
MTDKGPTQAILVRRITNKTTGQVRFRASAQAGAKYTERLYDMNEGDNARLAAFNLAKKLKWNMPALAAGVLPNGDYVFVRTD